MAQLEMTPQLFGALSAAPLQPEMWGVFLQELCALGGVSKAALISHDLAENDHKILACVGDGLNETVELYEDHYCQFDEWTTRFPKRFTNVVLQGEEIWPQDAFAQSIFYNEFLSTVGICEMACLAVSQTRDIFGGLSFYRGPREREFDREQLSMLSAIAPHLQTALYMTRRLAALELKVSDLETAFDQLDCNLVLIDATGRAVFVNRNARAILDRNECLSLHRGMLVAQSSSEASMLRGVVAKAVGVGNSIPSPGAMLISRIGRKPLQIIAVPFRSDTASMPRRVVATIFIVDPEQKTATPTDILRMLFGLTPAESSLAITLLDGKSLNEAAELLGVAKETVRSRIKSVFQKTGTKRQGELIRLLSLPFCNKL